MREYITYSKMLHNPHMGTVEQPDLKQVQTLHKLLDAVKDDNLALMLDAVVADLIHCNYPTPGVPPHTLPNEILPK